MEIQTNLMEIKPPSAKSLLIGGVIVVVTLFIAIIVLSTHKVVSSHNQLNSSSDNLAVLKNTNTKNLQNSQSSKSYKPTNYIPRPEAAIRSRQPPKILHSNSNTDDVSHHYNHRHVSIIPSPVKNII